MTGSRRRSGTIGVVAALILGTGTARAAEPLPPTVGRLDAERGSLEREAVEAETGVAAVRREASALESRRQEMLRELAAEGAAIAAREREAQAAVDALRARAEERGAEIEHVLRAGGLWVSFAADVAPLLRSRCVACHTAREPGGGHVMTSHAALLADAGGGAAVVPGDVDSPLVRAVADGSMPKDGTPLSAAEVDLLRRWVALGARLDAGIAPSAALVRIMPRRRQPDAPAAYGAALAVSALAFHPDGTRLASSGYHEVLVWSVPGGALLRRIGDVAERVGALAFHPDGRRLAVAAGTPGVLGDARLFDADSGVAVADLGAADEAFAAVAFTADGTRLAVAGADPAVRLFATDPVRAVGEHADHSDWVTGLAFSPDGRRLASASRDKTAKVIDPLAGRLLATFAGHQQPVRAVCWLPGGTLVATAGADGAVRIWDADSGKETRRIGGFDTAVEALAAVGPDRIAAGDRSGTVRIHGLADGKALATIGTGGSPVTALAVSPDGRMIAVGALDGSITLAPADGAGEPVRFRAAPR